MKRLLHRSKGDKKPENGSTSSATAAAKKTWTTSAGLGALQQSRARSGSNPQIRHLAMESHEGPVTKATMDDIRREATSNGSNLQINTFSFSATDINNSSEVGFASAPVAGALDSNINAATSDAKWKAQSRQQFRAVGSVALGSSVSQPATAPIDASVSADFPPRTTSVVLMSGLPPRIDTKVATTQKDRAHAVKSTSADARDPASAFTEDSDVSLALGASAVDSGGFDPPIYLRQPQHPQQQPPSPPMSLSSVSSHHSQPSQPATEGGKRVISEKIKKLAHRFSNSSLKEKHDMPVPPPAPQAISRRPSYSPSVSERVSLFDGHDFQTSSDPRISIFGKFGMASSQDNTHTRSFSASGNSTKNPALPLVFDSMSSDMTEGLHETHRPLSMGPDKGSYEGNKPNINSANHGSRSRHSSTSGKTSTRRTTVSGASASPNSSLHKNVAEPVRDRSASQSSRLSSGNDSNTKRSLCNSPKSTGLIYGLESGDPNDSSDGEESSNSASKAAGNTYQQVSESISDTDHQPTIAAGVHLSFPRPLSAIGSSATSTERNSFGYRGVRNEGASRRRGSIRSAFYATDEGLRTEQAAADPTGAAATIKSIALNSTINPIGTRTEKYGSLRRAGAVVPIPANSAVSDVQRSASTSNGYVADPEPFERSIPLSQPSTLLAPALSTVFTGTKRRSVDDLHTDTDTNLADVETYKITKDTLVSNLKRKSACTAITAGYGYLDSVLVKATNADVPPEDPEDDMGCSQSYSIKIRVAAALMAVEGVLKGVDNSKVLSSAEYERYNLEAASLKSSLQSARARLALEIRMRDAAKNLVDLRRGSGGAGVSMFKGKHSHQTQLDEYKQANEKVQQIEIEVTELSTKLRLLESGIHGHQLAILSSAVRTVVSESADTNEQAQAVERSLELRVASLEKQINDNSLEHSSEKEKLLAEHLATRQELEQQIRDLQNKNHEAITRFASKNTNSSDNESQISHHSANLAVERLTGEITVLKEQNQDALQLARVLEAKLDEAHLKTQETQNALDELRSQASDVAETSRIQLEFAREEARLNGQCTQAFVTGVRSIVGPLRMLRDAQDNVEKLRSSNGTDLPFSRTPPATPTLKMEPATSKDAISIDSLVDFFSRESEIDVVRDNAAGESSDRQLSDWNVDRAASAMALIRTMVSDSSIFYQESMKVYESCTRLNRDLGTEKRLREAQGLAISQQREKLAKANYLAESADQRVKEATESLLAEHANEKQRWSEERQRLFDNIERLTQDIKSLNSLDGGNHLQPLAPGARSNAVSSDASRSVDHPAVGKIEPLTVEALPRDSELQDRIDILEGRISELCEEITLAKQQLQAKIDENNVLQADLNTLKANNDQLHFLEDNINALRNTEQCLRNELLVLESLKQENAKLNRMLSEYKNGAGNSNLSSNRNARSFDYVAALGDKSLPGLTRSRSLTSLASLRDFSHTCVSGVQPKSNQQQRLFTANAQTMTESDIRPDNATTDEEVSQMLMAYSEKLVLKEDALHTREDELEAVRAIAAELEGVLQDMLASIESFVPSAANNNSHSMFAEHASPSSVSWSPAFSAQLKPGVRNRSASFFQGLRTNYLGMVDSSDMPSATPRAQTDILRPASVSTASDILGPASNPRDSGSASRQSPSGKHMFSASRTSGCNDVPLFVSSLLAMSHMAASEVRRLMPYMYELENQSHNSRVELRKKEDQLSQLQKYCTLRSKHEDVVQEDIAHVLAQITRLRTKVVSLENEKKVCEEEVQQAQARCRKAESQNIKQVLQLIVGRVGKREWEKNHLSDDLSKKTAVGVPSNDGADEPAPQPKSLATASTVAISHPEAGDIRAEFNELLHQIITRRDEDIERIQALADAWRIDARKALQLNEQRIWNTCTRGTQTTHTDHVTIV
ncbi:hypothetical protein H4217_001643 [Coemansia sp. RSA 1939]|nr:hypothetical protein H4217_001643 [Coemansia sp. RSA 1939]